MIFVIVFLMKMNGAGLNFVKHKEEIKS